MAYNGFAGFNTEKDEKVFYNYGTPFNNYKR